MKTLLLVLLIVLIIVLFLKKKPESFDSTYSSDAPSPMEIPYRPDTRYTTMPAKDKDSAYTVYNDSLMMTEQDVILFAEDPKTCLETCTRNGACNAVTMNRGMCTGYALMDDPTSTTWSNDSKITGKKISLFGGKSYSVNDTEFCKQLATVTPEGKNALVSMTDNRQCIVSKATPVIGATTYVKRK